MPVETELKRDFERALEHVFLQAVKQGVEQVIRKNFSKMLCADMARFHLQAERASHRVEP